MPNEPIRWYFLAHLGYNMWGDPIADWEDVPSLKGGGARRVLQFDETLFFEVAEAFRRAGGDSIVLDIGEGLVYPEYPDLAPLGAYSPDALRDVLKRVRSMGLEVIPKLNFSTTHAEWMGCYRNKTSTEPYYRFCSDVIRTVCEIFEKPSLFHLGMDEEDGICQKEKNLALWRNGDLWWHDFDYLAECVRSNGFRPWIWSDHMWKLWDELSEKAKGPKTDREGEFLSRMSKDVMQTNWYYRTFSPDDPHHPFLDSDERPFRVLDENGFDQIPGGSTWDLEDNLVEMVSYLTPRLSPDHLCGFMQTVWHPMSEDYREKQFQAVEAFSRAKKVYDQMANKPYQA
ncbi:MAG: hypothetical protein II719_06005 [Clostridia bacterium]|nr:hypothetical protein [Clostridia bacterium]